MTMRNNVFISRKSDDQAFFRGERQA